MKKKKLTRSIDGPDVQVIDFLCNLTLREAILTNILLYGFIIAIKTEVNIYGNLFPPKTIVHPLPLQGLVLLSSAHFVFDWILHLEQYNHS